MYNNISKIKPALFFIAAVTLTMTACQKKFDPASYRPKQTFGGYDASNQVAAADLVAHFAFEGNLVDSVSNTSAANSGTSNGPGIKGQGMQIGLGNYAVFTPTDAIKNLQSFTLSYWINTTKNTAGIQSPVCIVRPDDFWGRLDMFFDGQTDDKSVFKMHVWGTGGDQWMDKWSISSPFGKWIQIILTYDMTTGTFAFYVNGALIGSVINNNFGALYFSTSPAIVFGTTQLMTVPKLSSGGDPQSWMSYVLGSMDELRIFKKALGADDIKALYNLENLGK